MTKWKVLVEEQEERVRQGQSGHLPMRSSWTTQIWRANSKYKDLTEPTMATWWQETRLLAFLDTPLSDDSGANTAIHVIYPCDRHRSVLLISEQGTCGDERDPGCSYQQRSSHLKIDFDSIKHVLCAFWNNSAKTCDQCGNRKQLDFKSIWK